MRYIVSRYNHDLTWLKDYTDDFVLYDRSEVPLHGAIVVPNIGSDIYDKLTYIIDNYENLPDVAVYIKANLFKYISREEFESVKNNRTFTPLHTQHHKTKMPVSGYRQDKMYLEVNNRWFLNGVPIKFVAEYDELIGNKFKHQEYKPFSPGSNYILPKENILQHSKEFYMKLRSFLAYERYPGEAFLIERDLYNIWS